jgi:serine protease Do
MARYRLETPVWAAVVAIIVAVFLGGAAGAMVVRTANPTFVAAAASPDVAGAFNETFAPVVKAAAPAVVNISSSRVVKSDDSSQLFADPFFRRFFGDDVLREFGVPRERHERSLGSGIIVSSDGFILTNNHVVQDATDIKVFLSDKREFDAKVVGADPKTDLAVIKLNQGGLTALPLADSAQAQVGDVALAMGNPFGIGSTVTMGIISATGRGGLGIEDYEDFIQTDAAINPGNSGGPLIDTHGRVIGVNTAILSPTGGNLGIGFAVPANMARYVMNQISKTGKVERGFLGVVVQGITPDLASAMKLNSTKGALVADVAEDSPAAHAGLRSGDVITDVNGKSVEDSRQLQLLISQSSPGAKLDMRVVREGHPIDLSATLAQEPSQKPADPSQESRSSANPHSRNAGPGAVPPSGDLFDGVTFTDVTPAIARQLSLPTGTHGVVITDVQEGSVGAESGLKPGDIIQEANHQAVANVANLDDATSHSSSAVLLVVMREGRKLYLVMKA